MPAVAQACADGPSGAPPQPRDHDSAQLRLRFDDEGCGALRRLCKARHDPGRMSRIASAHGSSSPDTSR